MVKVYLPPTVNSVFVLARPRPKGTTPQRNDTPLSWLPSMVLVAPYESFAVPETDVGRPLVACRMAVPGPPLTLPAQWLAPQRVVANSPDPSGSKSPELSPHLLPAAPSWLSNSSLEIQLPEGALLDWSARTALDTSIIFSNAEFLQDRPMLVTDHT